MRRARSMMNNETANEMRLLVGMDGQSHSFDYIAVVVAVVGYLLSPYMGPIQLLPLARLLAHTLPMLHTLTRMNEMRINRIIFLLHQRFTMQRDNFHAMNNEWRRLQAQGIGENG